MTRPTCALSSHLSLESDVEIRIPDIGDFQAVPVIEVHVSPGDVVAA